MDFLRPLGSTGMHVSAIGLGTVKLGRNQGVRYPAGFKLPSDDEAISVLRTASDEGVNLIDTAPAYGVSEERLGRLMKRAGWFNGRDQWIVSTKVGEEFENGQSRFDFSPDAVRESIHRSLKRLELDALDVVLIHSSGDDENIIRGSGAVDALQELKRRGVVRAIGISSKTVAGGMLALDHGLDILMLTLNAAENDQLPVVTHAGACRAGVLIKKGLASGHAALNPGDDPVREAMSYIFNAAPHISSVVVGTINPAHLRHNVAIARSVLMHR